MVAPLLPLVAGLLLAEKLVDEGFVLVGLVVRGVLQGLRVVDGAPPLERPGNLRSDAEQLLGYHLVLGLWRHHWLQPGRAEGPRG